MDQFIIKMQNININNEDSIEYVVNDEDGCNYHLIFNEIGADGVGVHSEQHQEIDDQKTSRWDTNNTKFLLDRYKKYIELVRNRKIKSKNKMWDKIRQEFEDKNIIFTATQIENRFKTLERRYKNYKDNTKATGRGKIAFEFKE